MSQHTPGPWKCKRLIDNQGNAYWTHYQAHIDIDVCMVWAPVGNVEQEANANLIAAAPEMFEALHAIANMDYTHAATNLMAVSAVEVAKAAIAKLEAAQ